MAMKRWNPSTEYTRQEKFLMSRLGRTRKLFGFLRQQRHVLFDDAFQTELEGMYRKGGGKDPLPPALLCMALLLQAYVGASDAEAVELSVVDLRWQMVLGCLGSEAPAFSQGSLVNLRDRLIEHDMDRRLLERTRQVALETKAFDPKKLPTDLRVAVDSSPLVGAGRVEDTINLLGHAGRKIISCAATLLGKKYEEVAVLSGAQLLAQGSTKAALDINWNDDAEKAEALSRLMDQLLLLDVWVTKNLPTEATQPPLSDAVDTLRQIIDQDLEPDPEDGGRVRVREGVAKERRVSIEDKDMRHGRKSESKRFNGYKRHIATDLDTDLIAACAITAANRPEEDATSDLKHDLQAQGLQLGEVHIDRAYINSILVSDALAGGGDVFCKPWSSRNGGLFTKDDFDINVDLQEVTCPAGKTTSFEFGRAASFDPKSCADCRLRTQCTTSKSGGRSVSIAIAEEVQQELRRRIKTPEGRAGLRERVKVEHRLAHLSQKQGRRARYRGARKNLLDVRRSATVLNLEVIHRRSMAAQTLMAA